jgi:hypothetical protein
MVYGVYRPFQQYFSYIVAVSFIGGKNSQYRFLLGVSLQDIRASFTISIFQA